LPSYTEIAPARTPVAIIAHVNTKPLRLWRRPPLATEKKAIVPATSAMRAAPKWQTSISHTIPDDVAIVRCCILRTPH